MAVSYIDPVAQTFFVDASAYPKGMFVHSIDLVFRKKDTTSWQPFTLQLRPTENGYPSSSIITGSAALGEVVLQSSSINTVTGVGSDIPDITNPAHYTRFQFGAPVFLSPGEQAIILSSPSEDYELFIAQIGGTRLDGTDRRVDKNTYMGSFFKSQNGSTYTAYQEIDLMFRVNACQFSTIGTKTLIADSITNGLSSNTEYDLIHISSHDVNYKGTRVDYSYKATNNSTSTLDSTYTSVLNKYDNVLVERKIAYNTVNRSLLIEADLSTNDPTVAPVIDVSRLNAVVVKNIVNDCGLSDANFTLTAIGSGYTANAVVTITGVTGSGATAVAVANTTTGNITSIVVTAAGSGYTEGITATIAAPTVPSGNANSTCVVASETNAKGGPALARYITRKVVLSDGFDANMLRVYLTAYQPNDATIDVYYKIVADDDSTLFADRPYVHMKNVQQGDETLLNTLKSQIPSDYYEYLFIPTTTTTSYVGLANSVTYPVFRTFSIKIVMRTANPTYIPIIQDLRVIALAP